MPWPFITQGAVPVHVYDGKDVQTAQGCFTPAVPLQSSSQQITVGDYALRATPGPGLTCTQFDMTKPNGVGFCSFDVVVLSLPTSGLVYVNVHLDYAYKGVNANVNPADTLVDRYDIYTNTTGNDALVNTSDNTSGLLAVDDCTDYLFSYCKVEGASCSCPDGVPCRDTVENLNTFKKIAGAFGLCNGSGSEAPCKSGVPLQLVNSSNQVVQSTTTDQDGFFALVYKHTGKAAPYTVKLGAPYNLSVTTTLKANGWASVTFDVDTGKATSETACGGNPNCN